MSAEVDERNVFASDANTKSMPRSVTAQAGCFYRTALEFYSPLVIQSWFNNAS